MTTRQTFRIGSVTFDPGACAMSGPRGSVHVEPRVMDLAAHLARRAGEVVTRDDLIKAVWKGYPGADAALTASW